MTEHSGIEARVVNVHAERYDVYIGRGSRWGNAYSHVESAFEVIRVGTREEAIECYRRDLWERIRRGGDEATEIVYALESLHGQRLGCYCKPAPCHGDVLASAAEWAFHEVRRREVEGSSSLG